MATKKERSPKQLAFLDALFGEADGDIKEAKRIAGYSETYPDSQLIASLKEDILERTALVLAQHAPKAAKTFGNVMGGDTLAAKERLKAAAEVLDRVGLVKEERVHATISAPTGLFIMPAKDPVAVPNDFDAEEEE